MNTTEKLHFSRVKLVAPVVLILFAVGWYQFSVVYIQSANDQLAASNHLAVYVPIQQVQGYLDALLYATYVTVAAGLLAFGYFLTKFVRFRAHGLRTCP